MLECAFDCKKNGVPSKTKRGISYGARDARWYMWIPGIATLAALPFSLFAYLWDEPTFALWDLSYLSVRHLLARSYLFHDSGSVGLRMRALASGILLFVINIFGMGIGPQFTEILSDVFQATTDLGADSLRWALVVSLVFNLFAAILYWYAARTCARISRRRRSWGSGLTSV